MSSLSCVATLLLASVSMSLAFNAQSATPPAPTSITADSVQETSAESGRALPVAKADDRNCLRDTGSLIPPKKGECLPVAGRSYSSDELRRTGTNNNARALQMLDPSISVGGH